MEWLLLVVIGVLSGTLGSLVGLGGGIITVPALIYLGGIFSQFENVTPQIAVGTSLLVIIFTGLSSTLSYMKHKTIDYKSGIIFFIGSGPGGIVGAWLNQFFNVKTFSFYFGTFIIFISIVLLFRGRLKPLGLKRFKTQIINTYKDKDGTEITYSYQPILAIFIAFFVGMLGGMFGVGGGSLMVPAMILLFAFPPHIAIATSMFMILLSSTTSSITHIMMNNIDWMVTLALIPGAWVGGRLGAYINVKLKSNVVVHILRIILVIVGVRLIYQGVV